MSNRDLKVTAAELDAVEQMFGGDDDGDDHEWQAIVDRETSRHTQRDYFENLRDSDFDEYCRQNGSDALLRLTSQEG